MPNTSLSQLGSLLPAFALFASLLLATGGVVQCSEIGTFNATDRVVCRLLNRTDGSERVTRLEVQFRTSHAASSAALVGLRNADGERLTVLVANESQLTVRLVWLSGSGNGSGDGGDGGGDGGGAYAGGDGQLFELASLDLALAADGVGLGEWHRLRVSLDSSGGSLLLDDRTVGRLPGNFTAKFAWNGTAEAVIGGGFRGCLANASLDTTAQVPLHSGSELLNSSSTDGFISVNATASHLPGGGPGCRQEPCPCGPNGACFYQRWNALLGCNCSRGYEGQRCESEWDTCLHLEPGAECLNGGSCGNIPGPQAYKCSCTPAGQYLGSRCQSFNHCRHPVTCQNGANCTLIGDPETPSELNYKCACTINFTGRNCTDPVTQPDGGGVSAGLIAGVTVGVIAVLLLLIAALVAIKVVRDRRKDSGTYKPSQREIGGSNQNSVYADQAMIGMNQVMRPPKEERFI